MSLVQLVAGFMSGDETEEEGEEIDYSKIAEELADKCGNFRKNVDRCDQAVAFTICLQSELEARNIKIPFI